MSARTAARNRPRKPANSAARRRARVEATPVRANGRIYRACGSKRCPPLSRDAALIVAPPSSRPEWADLGALPSSPNRSHVPGEGEFSRFHRAAIQRAKPLVAKPPECSAEVRSGRQERRRERGGRFGETRLLGESRSPLNPLARARRRRDATTTRRDATRRDDDADATRPDNNTAR